MTKKLQVLFFLPTPSFVRPTMNNSDTSNGIGAFEIDYANVIDTLASLITVVQPSHSSILDTAEMVQASDHLSNETSAKGIGSKARGNNDDGSSRTSPNEAEEANKKLDANIKLDRGVTQMIAKDIESTKDNIITLNNIITQLLQFSKSSSVEAVKKDAAAAAAGADGAAEAQLTFAPSGTVTSIANTIEILNTRTKLEWLACICQENKVGVENLSIALRSGQQIWTTFTSAVYSSLDCMYQIIILWKLLGSYIDLKSLTSGSPYAVLDHNHPQVVHARAEIQSILNKRAKIVDIHRDPGEDVPITAILSDFILPILKPMEDTLL